MGVTTLDMRVAVVTGGSGGIGHAVGVRLAEAGHHVVSVDRSAPSPEQVARLGRGLSYQTRLLDLADDAGLAEFVRSIASRFGRLDVLVNNAGIHPKNADGSRQSIDDIRIEDWRGTFAVNVTAAFLLAQGALALMRERRWGRVINISSRAGRTLVDTAGAHYAASKSAIIGFTRVLAKEAGPHGITANCLAPGWIDSPLTAQIPEQARVKAASAIPVGFAGQPFDIAAAVEFLASDGSRYINGAVIDVNGGSFMG